MSSRTTRTIYLVIMCLAGGAIAVLRVYFPAHREGLLQPLPALMFSSLLVDLAIVAAAQRGRAMPLDMTGRFAGFLSGSAIYLLLSTAIERFAPVA